jgi:hypothetical protein
MVVRADGCRVMWCVIDAIHSWELETAECIETPIFHLKVGFLGCDFGRVHSMSTPEHTSPGLPGQTCCTLSATHCHPLTPYTLP